MTLSTYNIRHTTVGIPNLIGSASLSHRLDINKATKILIKDELSSFLNGSDIEKKNNAINIIKKLLEYKIHRFLGDDSKQAADIQKLIVYAKKIWPGEDCQSRVQSLVDLVTNRSYFFQKKLPATFFALINDLTDQDIQKICAGKDEIYKFLKEECNVTRKDIDLKNFSNIDFSYMDLSGKNFENVTFDLLCNLTNADLTGATINNCVLSEADLSRATLINTTFSNTYLDLTTLDNAETNKNTTFHNCNICDTSIANISFLNISYSNRYFELPIGVGFFGEVSGLPSDSGNEIKLINGTMLLGADPTHRNSADREWMMSTPFYNPSTNDHGRALRVSAVTDTEPSDEDRVHFSIEDNKLLNETEKKKVTNAANQIFNKMERKECTDVIVNCRQGKSRSAAIAIALIVIQTKVDPMDVMTLINNGRTENTKIYPNPEIYNAFIEVYNTRNGTNLPLIERTKDSYVAYNPHFKNADFGIST